MKFIYGLSIFFLVLCGCSSTYNIPSPSKIPVEMSPKEIDLLKQGIAFHDLGNYDEAIKIYKQVLEINPDNLSAIHEIAFSYYSKKDLENSLKYGIIGLQYSSPERYQFYTITGNVLDDMGKTEEAIDVYEEGISQFPGIYLQYFNAGVAYEKLNKPEKAEKSYISAISIEPGHASSFLALSNLYIKEGKQLPALLTICRFLLLEPDSHRSVTALDKLDMIMKSGIEKKDKDVHITQFATKENEYPYAIIEMALKFMAAASLTEEAKDMPIFNTDSLGYDLSSIFQMLDEDKKYNDFTGDFLFPYYSALLKSGNAQAFMFYIQQKSGRRGIEKWLNENEAKLDSLAEFENNYPWKIEN